MHRIRQVPILHEAFHIHWDQVNDQGFPQVHNAHCFEQFALDLKGIPINPVFADACAALAPLLHREVDSERALEYQNVIQQLMQTVHSASSNETVADSAGDTSPQIEGGAIG